MIFKSPSSNSQFLAIVLIKQETFQEQIVIIKQRYAGWDADFGQKIESGQLSFDDMEKYILENGEPAVTSGRQEMLENILNDYIC